MLGLQEQGVVRMVEAVVEAGKKGQHEKKSFYGYFGRGTREIADREERCRYRMRVRGT